MLKVGLIGLGTMGAAVAHNLLRAGFVPIVHDLARKKAAALEAAGAVWADSPAATVAACDVIMTMVFGPRELTEVLRAPHGMLAANMQGRGWVDMTTGLPSLTRELAAAVNKQGGWAIDAPVTGSVDAAIRGDMILFVGGADADVVRAMPILRAIGEPRQVGAVGHGQVAKLTNNLMWKINAAAIGEAMVTAQKAGMDIRTWWDAMRGGAADSFVLQHDAPSIFAGHYDPSFPLALCLKDWRLIADLLNEVGVRHDIAAAARARFVEAAARYGEAAGEMTVCKLLEEDAGVNLRAAGDWTAPWEVKHPDEK